jgi:hypothetical protein
LFLRRVLCILTTFSFTNNQTMTIMSPRMTAMAASRTRLALIKASRCGVYKSIGLRALSTASSDYVQPKSVAEWERLAEKELKRAKTVTVDSLRTQRITPEGISLQPVYYDLESDNPEMPGVSPFTRGPYGKLLLQDCALTVGTT